MTEEFETISAGVSTGTWRNPPPNTAILYSLPRSTEISLDFANFPWQNFETNDEILYDHNDDDDHHHTYLPTSQISSLNQSIMNDEELKFNPINSFFEGLFDPNDQFLSDSWKKSTISNPKSELSENFPFFDNMFLIDSEAESFLDNEIQQQAQEQHYKSLTSKRVYDQKSEELAEKTDENSVKRARLDTLSPLPSFKVRKEKLGDRITALQQLVSPFGKTDTASVLNEAIEYIKFLQEQVTVLSNPDKNTIGSVQQQQCSDKKSSNNQECSSRRQDLKSRGLCLMPISTTYPVAAAAAASAEMNTSDFWNLPFSVTL